ncbi:hypothetical protein GUI12_00985 [Anaplasmataceae bacterium AB001_6]|nr:hypothetical protein GUI12_00985 [Anaplasmataceae bacterium AB001_6]
MRIGVNNSTYISIFLIMLDIVFSQHLSILSDLSLDLVALSIFSVFRLSFLFWLIVGLIYDILYNFYFGLSAIFYITLHFLSFFIIQKIVDTTDMNREKSFYIKLLVVFNLQYVALCIYRLVIFKIINDSILQVEILLNILCIFINSIILVIFLSFTVSSLKEREYDILV